jgi:hypothetical protein
VVRDVTATEELALERERYQLRNLVSSECFRPSLSLQSSFFLTPKSIHGSCKNAARFPRRKDWRTSRATGFRKLLQRDSAFANYGILCVRCGNLCGNGEQSAFPGPGWPSRFGKKLARQLSWRGQDARTTERFLLTSFVEMTS